MNTRISTRLALGTVVLLTLSACGGGGGSSPTPTPPPQPTYATALVYTNPPTGAYQLQKNVSLSRSDRLVLDLVAVNAGSGAGVAFHLTTDGTRATWAKVADTDPEYARNGTVFNLGSGSQAFKTKLSGNTLQVVVAQKGYAGSPVLNGTLATIALSLKSQVLPGTVGLEVVSGKAQVLKSDGVIGPLAITPGNVSAQ